MKAPPGCWCCLSKVTWLGRGPSRVGTLVGVVPQSAQLPDPSEKSGLLLSLPPWMAGSLSDPAGGSRVFHLRAQREQGFVRTPRRHGEPCLCFPSFILACHIHPGTRGQHSVCAWVGSNDNSYRFLCARHLVISDSGICPFSRCRN